VTTETAANEDARKTPRFDFDPHTPQYREQFTGIAGEMISKCPLAWTDNYEGHWVATGHAEVFEIARSAEYLSNDSDPNNERRGYVGVRIPHPEENRLTGGFLEMDPPKQRYYRQLLNPYLSPAAVNRWVPVADELIRASLDEKIESGRIDFVDDLANIVPAVLTMAMLGIPLKQWTTYVEPIHATMYTPPESPEMPRLMQLQVEMFNELLAQITEARSKPERPGMINALTHSEINGQFPDDMEILGVLFLLLGGGFDTTTALTAHTLEWLSEHPADRTRLSQERATLLDTATEEFLRFFTPAPGDGRTISTDCEIAGASFKEGDRLWLSWAISNRDPEVFANPNEIDMARTGNRHHSFGLGIHRCIGSNMARMVFKRMVTAVLDRMPDFVCDPATTVHYETIGVIQGMRHLPATFTPGPRIGDGLDETIDRMQAACDEQRLAEPVTVRKGAAEVAG
jgi:cytochrome P450